MKSIPIIPSPTMAWRWQFLTLGRETAALPYAEAAVRQAPDNALYHLFLGKLYVDLEMLEFAPAVLEKAAALDNTMFQAPWIMAEYYFGLGQADKALPYYEEALKLVPKDTVNRLKIEYAGCIATLGRVDEAEAVYYRVVQRSDVSENRAGKVCFAPKTRSDSQKSRRISAVSWQHPG